jgi:hypothetical protein
MSTPDHLTLRLRPFDRRSSAELAALVLRELAPRPPSRDLAPTLADVGLSRADRRLVSFRERYRAAAARLPDGVLWAAAHGHRQPAGRPTRRPCGWDMARAYARRHRQPPPRVEEAGRLVLGEPCPSCAVALGFAPPKPGLRPTSTSASTSRSAALERAQRAEQRVAGLNRVLAAALDELAEVAGGPTGGISPATAAYNWRAARRLGMNPARFPYLTRPAPTTTTRGRGRR